MRLVELASSGPVVLVDAGVVRDMASALTGVWTPDTGRNRERSADLVAAARLRLYGDRTRSGWCLLTTRPGADAALRRGDADWSVGMLPVAEEFEDAPAPAEVAALAEMYAREQGVAPIHHLQHLVVHGLLHLLGFDHDTEAQAEVMERLEVQILAALGVPDPYAAAEGP